MLVDGTANIQTIDDLDEPTLKLIDTPGLDSSNFTVHVTEQIQKKHHDQQLLIVLVINARSPRVTSYISKFATIMLDLVGNERFCILWTNHAPGSLDPMDLNAMQGKFPLAQMCYDSDLASFRQTFLANFNIFKPLKATVAKAVAAASPPTVLGKRAAAASADATEPTQVKAPRGFPLSLPVILQTRFGFSMHLKKNHTLFEARVQTVLLLKKTGGTEYQALKLMGDAILKPTVLNCLYAHGERDELETKAHRVTDEGADCAMPRFFAKHLATTHAQVFPRETSTLSPHGQCDVVEALLEHTRVHRDAYGFRFILVELFTLVGMGDVVGESASV